MELKALLEVLNIAPESVVYPQGKTADDYGQTNVSDICLNANDVKSGDIFPVTKGIQFDGLTFVPEAIQNGAVALLADRNITAKIPVICVPNLRKAIAVVADALHPTPQMQKVAVTGTNGKTSVAYFTQQILNRAEKTTASLGTIGIQSPVYQRDGKMTTPDAVTLHKSLEELAQHGVEFVALEASSHGLDQERVGAIEFVATGFTNLTRDHLDYHQTMEAYLAAKMKLFTERTRKDGVVVLNADVPEFQEMAEAVKAKGIRIYSYGANGKELKLLSRIPVADGQNVVIEVMGQIYTIHLNLYGDFQIMNILCAVGLCLAVGLSADTVMRILPTLKAPDGRMEHVATVNGAPVFVDYAHTPDALERVLISLKPHTQRHLVCVFGCGGNRDTGKRPQMGEIADRLADIVYITDDNPRLENASDIRRAIKEACPKGVEIDGREEALYEAIHILEPGDVLVVCGKGHETGQTIGETVYRFNDRTEILSLAATMEKEIIWKSTELAMALNTTVCPYVNATGVSIDTRTLEYGDLFIALKGERTDGHNYVATAIDKGASACIVDHLVEHIPVNKQIIVEDTQVALESLARFARMRSEAVFIGITGSSGKTTSKEMLRTVLGEQGNVFATQGNLNNQIGVPLMLARMPLNTEYAVIEMGMNHFGEMAFLSEIVRPNHTLITTIGGAHREYFKSDDDIAVAKGEIYEYADQSGTAVLNKEIPQFHYLLGEAQKAGIRRVVTFGERHGADFELTDCTVDSDKTIVRFKWNGLNYTFCLCFAGRHFALDALGVLAMVDAVGASVEQAMRTIETVTPLAGRGKTSALTLPNGQKITLIDDSYNANPKSVSASLDTLGAYRTERRIAVLGDMLELGEFTREAHIGLQADIERNQIDKVYAVGLEMKNLYDVLPVEKQGFWTQTATEMIPVLMKELQTGDVVLVKASNGMGMKKIVSALKGDE